MRTGQHLQKTEYRVQQHEVLWYVVKVSNIISNAMIRKDENLCLVVIFPILLLHTLFFFTRKRRVCQAARLAENKCR